MSGKIVKQQVTQWTCTDGKAFNSFKEAELHQQKIDALVVLRDFFTKPDIDDFLNSGECGLALAEFMVDDLEAFEYLVNGLKEALKPKNEAGKF